MKNVKEIGSDVVRKASKQAEKTKQFCVEHKKEIIIATCAVGTGVVCGVAIQKGVDLKKGLEVAKKSINFKDLQIAQLTALLQSANKTIAEQEEIIDQYVKLCNEKKKMQLSRITEGARHVSSVCAKDLAEYGTYKNHLYA